MDSKGVHVNIPYRIIISNSGMNFSEWVEMLNDTSSRYEDVMRISADRLGLKPTPGASLSWMPSFIIEDEHKYLLAKLRYGF